MLRVACITAVFALAAAAVRAEPVSGRPHVTDSSVVEPSGERVMREEILIKAPRSEVWKALATSQGLRSWELPLAEIDLKIGGHLEASYDPKAKLGDPNNIKHEILTYVPERLLVFRNIQTPQGFPHADLFSKVTSVLILDDAGDGVTRVTEAGVGYGQGADWDQLYSFFHNGNAWVLEMLKAHFEGGEGPNGPVH
jgi:uncharacterized protein YndB with AHSA1/START domain